MGRQCASGLIFPSVSHSWLDAKELHSWDSLLCMAGSDDCDDSFTGHNLVRDQSAAVSEILLIDFHSSISGTVH